MYKSGGNRGDVFQDIVASYLELDAVEASALITSDGLLVASAGDSVYDLETLAALSSPMISKAREFAAEFGGPEPGLMSLSLSGHGVILAPMSEDMFLVLVGGTGMLAYGATGTIRP